MKKYYLALTVFFLVFAGSAVAQKKWSELSKEEKIMKAKSFSEDNHKYMKDSLKLTTSQIEDIDNVNVCYLSTLDRIDRYGKTDANKEKFADYATAARSAQLDAIMGTEMRDRFMNYVAAKLKKAGVSLD